MRRLRWTKASKRMRRLKFSLINYVPTCTFFSSTSLHYWRRCDFHRGMKLISRFDA